MGGRWEHTGSIGWVTAREAGKMGNEEDRERQQEVRDWERWDTARDRDRDRERWGWS